MTTEEKAPTIADLRKKLTKKQAIFCESYLTNNYNKKQAAIKAGYAEANARVQAHAILQNVNVRAYVDALITKTMEAEIIELKGLIISEFKSLGFSDIKHILDEYGNIDLSKVKDIDSRAIKSIRTDVTTQGSGDKQRITEKVAVTYHDKLKALEIMAKYAGMLVEKLEVGFDPDKPLPLTVIINDAGTGKK